MFRRRLTVFPWGLLETTEYVDQDNGSLGPLKPSPDSDQDELLSGADQCTEGEA